MTTAPWCWLSLVVSGGTVNTIRYAEEHAVRIVIMIGGDTL